MHRIRQTLLTLREFCTYMDLNPWYFAQIGGEDLPLRDYVSRFAKCEDVTYEFNWQDEHLSREMVADAIWQAEQTFANYAGYWPAPKWFTGETHGYRAGFDPRRYGYRYGNRGEPHSTSLQWGYITDFGIEELTLIETVNVVTSDSNGDGIDDRFTATVNPLLIPEGLLASEVAIFFEATDRNNEPLNEWEIAPIRVTLTDLPTLIIQGEFMQLVSPDLYTVTAPSVVNPLEPLNFVARVSVYRRRSNTDDQGYFQYSLNPAIERVAAHFGIRDTKLGVATVLRRTDEITAPPGVTLVPVDCGQFPANEISINYRAGFPRNSDGTMDSNHAQIISKLAAGYLECLPCGCACGDNESLLSFWAEVPHTKINAPRRQPMVTFDQMNNPFGVSRGAIWAWNRAKDLKIWKSGVVT